MVNCMKRVIKYLTENGYNQAISTKVLASPSSKDYFNIFQFLYQKIDPMYELGKTPQDDIPNIFKELHYPTRITRSALVSPGSPHTWPGLLAALVWLVELLEYDAIVSSESSDQDRMMDDPGALEDREFNDYIFRAYDAFLKGYDDEALYSEYTANLAARNEALRANVGKMMQVNEGLTKEIHQLENAPSRVVALAQKKKVLEVDVEKFSTYAQQLEAQKQEGLKAVEELQNLSNSMDTQIQELQAENEELQKIIDSQGITPTDLERMLKARQTLEQSLQSLVTQKEETNKLIWEREMSVAKMMDDVERAIHMFNTTATNLKLVGPSSSTSNNFNNNNSNNNNNNNSISISTSSISITSSATSSSSSSSSTSSSFSANHGKFKKVLHKDFACLFYCPHATTVDKMLQPCSIKEVVKPSLSGLKEHLHKKSIALQELQTQLQVEVDKIEEIIEDQSESLVALQAQLKRVETAYKTTKQAAREALRRRASEMENLQSEIRKYKSDNVTLLQQSEKALEKTNQELEEVERTCQKERDTFEQHLIETMNVLMEHRTYISDTLAALQIKLQEELDSLS